MALAQWLDKARAARADLRVVPPVQQYCDSRLLQIGCEPLLDPALMFRYAPGIADEALWRRDLLLGHVGAHAKDRLLKARPLLGGPALRFHFGLHFPRQLDRFRHRRQRQPLSAIVAECEGL